MLPRFFRNRQQVLVAHADFELELDELAAMGPVAANLVHQFRGAHQAQPKLRLIALDLAGGPIEHGTGAGPNLCSFVKVRVGSRREDAGGAIIVDRRTMDDGVRLPLGDVAGHQVVQILERAVRETLPARGIEMAMLDHIGLRGRQDYMMPAAIRLERNGRAGASGENIRDAADAIDRDLRIARGDEDAHGLIIHSSRSILTFPSLTRKRRKANLRLRFRLGHPTWRRSRCAAICVPCRRDGFARHCRSTERRLRGAGAAAQASG